MLPALEILVLFMAFAGRSETLDSCRLSIAIRDGDVDAFRQFYNDYYSELYRFLASRGMSHDEAQDLIQQAFVMIWDKRKNIDENKSLRAYLFQIAYTRMLNHVAFQSKFNEGDPPDSDMSAKTPDSESDYDELLHHIRGILSRMPEKRALVFELCFMKEFTYKETAAAMDVSVKTVENHMTLAFKEMRAHLTKIYGTEKLKSHNI